MGYKSQMEIQNLEQAQAVINLLTQQRESISNSYVLQVAEFQALARITQDLQTEVLELKKLLEDNYIPLPGSEEDTKEESKTPSRRVKK
jgi:hypothetical protein